ncbi:WbqC family protein [Petrimonas sp.]|uniref:WbqC family protein n=1 Tax=Petrimonas TaxID=307628 RepID=UPI002FCB5262
MEQVISKCKKITGRVLLSSFYLAPVEYYSVFFRASSTVIEVHENYQKQSYRNRCNIVGANGSMALSIPVEKPSAVKCRMKDVRIADHGNWRHLHWNAIVSAYSSTPFFEYYADELQPFYEKRISFLVDFNLQLHELICGWLRIEQPTNLSPEYVAEIPEGIADHREAIHPKRPSGFMTRPYYQVFQDKLGFIQNASIIDLVFNMGNEARLWL